MNQETSNSLVNFGDLSKPATVLIEKISDAVGGLFKPYQIKKIAKAEVEADLIREEGRIVIQDIHRRAMHRFVEEEAKRQLNIESITEKALPLLNKESLPQNVEDDWITNFFDKCRIVSNKDMQKLWSNILAGEANMPGAFSKRTVNLLADIDRDDAELFTRLCGFSWAIGNVVPMVLDVQDNIYNNDGINFSSVSHLDSLGLVQFQNVAGFVRLKLPKVFDVFYYGKPLRLTFPEEADNKLDIGKVLLTQAGQELANVCDCRPVDGFFDFIYDKWEKKSYVPKKNTEQVTQIETIK